MGRGCGEGTTNAADVYVDTLLDGHKCSQRSLTLLSNAKSSPSKYDEYVFKTSRQSAPIDNVHHIDLPNSIFGCV